MGASCGSHNSSPTLCHLHFWIATGQGKSCARWHRLGSLQVGVSALPNSCWCPVMCRPPLGWSTCMQCWIWGVRRGFRPLEGSGVSWRSQRGILSMSASLNAKLYANRVVFFTVNPFGDQRRESNDRRSFVASQQEEWHPRRPQRLFHPRCSCIPDLMNWILAPWQCIASCWPCIWHKT